MSGPWILVFMLEVVLDVIYSNEAIIHIFFTDIPPSPHCRPQRGITFDPDGTTGASDI
jgi:hypothetical protein